MRSLMALLSLGFLATLAILLSGHDCCFVKRSPANSINPEPSPFDVKSPEPKAAITHPIKTELSETGSPKVYSDSDAVSYGLKALQEQPQAKEVMDMAKRKGDSLIKDLENAVKDTVMEYPATVLVLGAHLVMDQKISASTTTPWDQKVRFTIKPDKAEVSWGGQEFMFIDGLKYDISTDSKSTTSLNVNMDF